MKKTSFQIQQFDGGSHEWVIITKKINSEEMQKEVMKKILEVDEYCCKIDLLSPHYAPLYRMRLRDKSWFYFSVNPHFTIINGRFICE